MGGRRQKGVVSVVGGPWWRVSRVGVGGGGLTQVPALHTSCSQAPSPTLASVSMRAASPSGANLVRALLLLPQIKSPLEEGQLETKVMITTSVHMFDTTITVMPRVAPTMPAPSLPPELAALQVTTGSTSPLVVSVSSVGQLQVCVVGRGLGVTCAVLGEATGASQQLACSCWSCRSKQRL